MKKTVVVKVKKAAKKEVAKVKVHRHPVEEEIKRVRLPENVKPYEGLTPGTPEWKACWVKYPHLQSAMLSYKNKHFTEEDAMKAKEIESRKKELAEIDAFIKKNGVEKVKSKPAKGMPAEELFDEEDEDLDEDENEEVEEVKPKAKTVKKEEVKKPQMVLVKTANRPFGAEGRTIDLYADPIPSEIRTIPQLIKHMKSEGRYILELDNKTGQLRLYVNNRVTQDTNRVAKVTVKAQGSRMLVTYRSNKNSKLNEDE